MEQTKLTESCTAGLITGGSSSESLSAHGYFEFECIDANGNLKWKDHSENLVVTQGRNAMLDTYLGNTQVPPTSYMSLIVSGAAIPTSTYAAPGFQEITGNVVTAGHRVAMTWTAASGNSKVANTTSFGILASATIIGNMVVNGNLMVGGGSNVIAVADTVSSNGILFSSSNFTAGSKNVSSGDTLNVSYTISV